MMPPVWISRALESAILYAYKVPACRLHVTKAPRFRLSETLNRPPVCRIVGANTPRSDTTPGKAITLRQLSDPPERLYVLKLEKRSSPDNELLPPDWLNVVKFPSITLRERIIPETSEYPA